MNAGLFVRQAFDFALPTLQCRILPYCFTRVAPAASLPFSTPSAPPAAGASVGQAWVGLRLLQVRFRVGFGLVGEG